ncbi:hypothetical protein AB4238_11230 [Shewanella sp. 10N.286.45.A1]|uniref:hypothetical protein n=1 Tax=Shewanella sp. 10N.286.45.A1 TaxID=3229694 RepID=UPI0035521CAF
MSFGNHKTMYIQDDESLQSAIFRSIVLSGEDSFENVVGDNGNWLHRPKVSGRGGDFFQNIDFLKLVELARRSGGAQPTEGRFGTFSSLANELFDTFIERDNCSSVEKGTLKVGYCEQCIQESIKNLGFGYLKSEWINWKTDKLCLKHQTPLHYIASNSRKKTVKAIAKALSGDFSIEVWRGRKGYIENYPFHLNFEQPLKLRKTEVCYLPCAKQDLYCWLSKNIGRFNRNNKLRKSLWFKNFSSYTFLSDETLEFMCDAIEQNEVDGIADFIYSYLEETSCEYGKKGRFLFQYNAYKSKFQSCSKCTLYSADEICPKFAIIQVGDAGKQYIAAPAHFCGVVLQAF